MIVGIHGLPKAQLFENVHSDAVPWSLHWPVPPSPSSPFTMTRTTPGHFLITWTCCVSNILTSSIPLQPQPSTPPTFSCQFRVPLSPSLAKARRIQLPEFYMPRVLLEKIIQPGRLEPLSVTGPQGQLGFQCYWTTCSSTVNDGSRDAYTVHGIIFKSSVQFSHSVVSDSLRPHEPQRTRPSCPSPTPRVHPNPCPLSRWCHPTISSSVIPYPPALNLPSIRVFSNESALCIRWPKYWSFSFNISPSSEHPGPLLLLWYYYYYYSSTSHHQP